MKSKIIQSSLISLSFVVCGPSFAMTMMNADIQVPDGYVMSEVTSVTPEVGALYSQNNCQMVKLLTPEESSTEDGVPASVGSDFLVNCLFYDMSVTAAVSSDIYQVSWESDTLLSFNTPEGENVDVDVTEYSSLYFEDVLERTESIPEETRHIYELAYVVWSYLDGHDDETNLTESGSSSINDLKQSLEDKADGSTTLVNSPNVAAQANAANGSYNPSVTRNRNDSGHGVVTSAFGIISCGNTCRSGQSCNTAARRKRVDQEGNTASDCGHILARALGGTGAPNNTFPQNRNINRGTYRSYENTIRQRAESSNCQRVDVSWNFGFPNSSTPRPNSVTYSHTYCGGPGGVFRFSETMSFSN